MKEDGPYCNEFSIQTKAVANVSHYSCLFSPGIYADGFLRRTGIKLFLKACESSKNQRIRCVISATGEAFLVE
jgi:hypothetical protein